MGDFLKIAGLCAVVGVPLVAAQFFCCLLKPKALKFIPLIIDLFPWALLAPGAGFKSPLFLWVLLQPFVIPSLISGWALYGLYLQMRVWMKEPGTREEKRRAVIFSVAMMILVFVVLIALFYSYVTSLM